MGVLFASKEGPLIMLKSMIVIAFIVVAAVALPSFNDEVVPEEELVGATCTCCGKTVSKPSCSITLYQHCNYGGYGINLAPGSYNMNTLIAKGMKNDDLSSVRIHGSCRAILYQHINFGGASMTKDSDDSCFTNDRMAIPVSQLHQLVVTERPKMPEDEENEDDEVDEVDTKGRRKGLQRSSCQEREIRKREGLQGEGSEKEREGCQGNREKSQGRSRGS